MIARLWHGLVPVGKADEYLGLMREVALRDYQATPGNRGAWCLCRPDGAVVHFEMLTFWDDIDAVKGFAGEDVEAAKYYDFDPAFLLEMEPRVRHYDAFDY